MSANAKTEFGLGHINDPRARRVQASSRVLFGSPSPRAVPAQVSLERREAPTFDQGGFSSCGGHGTAQGLAIAAVGGSQAPALSWVPSPDWIYKIARLTMRAEIAAASGTLPPLGDIGVYPAAVMAALATYGVIPYHGPTADGRVSDCDATSVNQEETLSDFEAGQAWVVTGEYRLDPTAPDFMPQLALALQAGYSVGLGIFVDSPFMAWGRGWTPARPPIDNFNLGDRFGGGHWVCADAIDLSAGPSGVVSGPNSWGDGWGAPALLDSACPNPGGHWRITGNGLRQAVSDAYVFKVAVLPSQPAAHSVAHLVAA